MHGAQGGADVAVQGHVLSPRLHITAGEQAGLGVAAAVCAEVHKVLSCPDRASLANACQLATSWVALSCYGRDVVESVQRTTKSEFVLL